MSESAQISSLELEVQSNATGAKKSLDSLISTLNKLKTASKSASGLQSVSEKLRAISSSVSSDGVKNLSALVGSLEKLGTIGNLKISSSVANQLKEITSAAKAMNGVSFSQITNLSASLSHLNNIKKGNLGTVLNQLKKVPEAVAGLNAIDETTSEKVRQLVGSLSQLSSIPKNNLSGIVNSMAKIPKVVDELDDSKLDQFDQKIKKITSSLQPLATQLSAIKGSFSVLTNGVNRANSVTNRMSGTFRSSGASANVLGEALQDVRVRLVATYMAARSVATVISGWINESTKYVEDLNLFTVAMGKYADSAQEYANTVSQVMGIDPAQWMRNQGIFMTLATGFGVASDRAEIMSRNLTQLAYDISSFYNLNVEEAFSKLQSGISGELEPLRRLGYDLSDARLQATALSLGIDESTQSMDQAEKAQLRYYAIMTQVTTAQGDMARTLEAPANQLRILQAQLTQAARALGNIFIPALNAVLPYAIAFLRAVREIADAIAELFGYTLPEIDYSGVDSIGSSADGATDSVEGTTDAVKELQKTIASFDELHILSDNTNDSVSAGAGSDGNEFDFSLPEYDFLGDVVSTRADEIFESIRPQVEWIKDHLDDILDVATLIGGVFLAWKFAKGFTNVLQTLSDILNPFGKKQSFKTSLKNGLGIGFMLGGLTFSGFSASNIGDKIGNDIAPGVEDWISLALSNAFSVFGAALRFGSTGAVAMIPITLTVSLLSFVFSYSKSAVQKGIEDAFGDVDLSDAVETEWAKKLTTSDLTLDLDLYVDATETYENAKEALEEATTNLRGYYIRSQIGLEVDKDDFISQVDSYVEQSQAALDARHEQMSLAVDIMLDDSRAGMQLQTALSNVFSNAENNLISLGEQLKQTINEGFSNGEWIADKKAEAERLLDEMQEIQNDITSASIQATLEGLKLDSGADITAESYDSVVQQAQERVNQQIEELRNTRQTALEAAALSLNRGEITKEEYNNLVQEIQSGYEENVATLNGALQSFQADALTNAFGATNNTYFSDTIERTQGTDYLQNVTGEQAVQDYFRSIRGSLQEGLNAVSDDARNGAVSVMDDLADCIGSYQRTAINARALGNQIPEEILNGLDAYYNAAYIAGDLSGMMYQAGKIASDSPEFYQLMSICDGMGSSMDESMKLGILASADLVVNQAGNLVNQTTGTILVRSEDMTDTLKQNLSDLGYDAGNAYATSATSAAGNIDANSVVAAATERLRQATDQLAANWQSMVDDAMSKVDIWKNANPELAGKLNESEKAMFNSYYAAAAAGGASSLSKFTEMYGVSYDDWVSKGKPNLNRNRFASGGYPPSGEMFIAREAGPELVGRIGNRTAVANNDQITAAISSAVYSAIVNAKASGGVSEDALYRAVSRALNENNSDIVMQVDSEELYRAAMSGKQKYGKRHNAMVEVL